MMISRVLLLVSACVCLAIADPTVTLGNMVLRNDGFSKLKGHRVAVLTNPTGVFVDTMTHIVDVMNDDDAVNVVAVFGPEHGFRGDKQAETGDPRFYIDDATNLPVFSAYNMTSLELSEVITRLNITTIVVDMQDVGVRLYTFIWTMYDFMAGVKLALNQNNHATKMVVLDRPNPLNGLDVGGPLLHENQRSGYGKYPITHIHGMTIGELSVLFNEAILLPRNCSSSSAASSSCLLEVVQMIGWQRAMTWKNTGLPWIPPSPNLPTVASAVVYGATVFLEATTVSEGRGTTTPFEQFGAPFLGAQALAARLASDFPLPSGDSAFRAAYYIPTFSKFNGTTVPGVQWISDRTSSSYDAFLSGTKILCAVRDLSTPPEEFQWDGVWFGHPGTELIDQYAGTSLYRSLLNLGKLSAEEIVDRFSDDVRSFTATRTPYLLY